MTFGQHFASNFAAELKHFLPNASSFQDAPGPVTSSGLEFLLHLEDGELRIAADVLESPDAVAEPHPEYGH